MIPWPSAFSMFLIPFIGYLLLSAKPQKAATVVNPRLLLAGAAVFLVVLTRVQIGVVLTLGCFLLFLAYSRIRDLVAFLVGYILLATISFSYFIKVGIFSNIFDDVIRFGSTYAFGDRTTYPKPIWTFVLCALFIAAYFVFLGTPVIKPNRIVKSAFFALAVSLVVLASFYLSKRNLSFVQILTVGFRRVWISVLLATFFIAIFTFIFNYIKDKKLPEYKYSLLIGFSLVAELQIWPLFDQMHAWWGATPIVVLAVFYFTTHKQIVLQDFASKARLEYVAIFGIVLISLTTFTSSLSHSRVPLNLSGFSGVLIDSNEGKELEGTNSFLNNQISKSDRVLNLCTNANVFFESIGRPSSASRIFVFWSPLFDIEANRRDILSSMPTKVVTCSLVTNPLFYPEYLSLQDNILDNFGGSLGRPAVYISHNKVIWKVYSRN
jgi:hypothetical protein